MSDPSNPSRAGEQWNPYRLAVLEREVLAIREFGALSGGWAWHFMSPPHIENKQLHDHKDIDLLVYPHAFASLVTLLQARGHARTWTRFDDPSGEFVRFTRYIEHACPECHDDTVLADGDRFACIACNCSWATDPCTVVKVILDLFVSQVPTLELADGICVVEPATLLSFYGVKHSSGGCVAVQAARELVAAGLPVPGHASLVGDYGST